MTGVPVRQWSLPCWSLSAVIGVCGTVTAAAFLRKLVTLGKHFCNMHCIAWRLWCPAFLLHSPSLPCATSHHSLAAACICCQSRHGIDIRMNNSSCGTKVFCLTVCTASWDCQAVADTRYSMAKIIDTFQVFFNHPTFLTLLLILALTMLLQAAQVNTPQQSKACSVSVTCIVGLLFMSSNYISVALLMYWYAWYRYVQKDTAGGRRGGEAGLGPAAQLYL